MPLSNVPHSKTAYKWQNFASGRILKAEMSSSRKKAILRKHTRDWVAGYLPLSGFAREGALDLLDLDGKVASYSLADVKWVCFVRDFNSGELNNPERLLRKSCLLYTSP